MKTIQQRWSGAIALLSLYQTTFAFHLPQQATRVSTELSVVDPNDIASVMSSAHSFPSEVSAILSTALSTAIPAAHGHSNPVFGSPDPYLVAGKSIAPSVKALADMGIAPAKTVGDLLPNAAPEFQHSVAEAVKNGWNILDKSHIHGSGLNHLPGFSDTRGIFGTRMEPFDSPQAFMAEVKWASSYFSVMDKLPFVAFYYALVEFFILRPGVDLYKEEIEDDPEGVLADTVSVGIVRLGAFAVISFFTVVFS
jgi:hypothetical protein